MPNFKKNSNSFKLPGFTPFTKTIAKEKMFTDSQDKEKPSIPKKSTQMQEANAEERAIMKQQDALHEKMKGLDKNSKEYKDLMDKSRDLDNQLPAFD
jgi:predicted transcriptional regulator